MDKTRRLGRAGIAGVVILLTFLLLSNSAQANPIVVEETAVSKIAPEVWAELNARTSQEMVTVIVTMQERANLTNIRGNNRQTRIRKVIEALQNTANTSQEQIKIVLETHRFEGKVDRVDSFWVFNGLLVTALPEVIEGLAALPQVASITSNQTFAAPPAPAASNPPETNLSLVGAPDLWGLGYTGLGIVVANMDTGVYLNHPDLVNQWRGGTNSWFDPYGEHPDTPADANGHGTLTMGVMVGQDTGGTAIGVAPDAQWIAVKIFDDQDEATTAGIHAGYQWILDPDGNPGTADTPHIVNNSWTFQVAGCDLEFQADLQALRAAGIVPLFAAGNAGGAAASSTSPGNNPEAFAVGATDNNDVIYVDGSRGPSSCGEAETFFPELVAPGVNVRSTDLFGTYSNNSGTSLAAPHVGGGLALLLEAFPNLTVEQQEAALINGVVDLGSVGPDDTFGNGRLDILASYQWQLGGGNPTATPSAPPPSTASHYLSFGNDGSYTVGSVSSVANEDILTFDGSDFGMFFDGSDVGLADANVDAVHLLDGDTILFSFAAEITLGSLGTVDDSDIVQFDATSLGDTTAGTFSWYFDGSDVGLTRNSENIDGLTRLDDGRLLISTSGNTWTGGVIGRDEDLLAFTPTSLGEVTSGSWAVYFDGSDVALTDNGEDLDGTAVDSSGALTFSTWGAFDISTVAGDDDDLFTITLSSSGENTVGTYDSGLTFDGSQYGLSGNDINGVSISTDAPPSPTATPPPATATNTPPPATATNTPPPATATNTPPPATATNTPPPATATNTPATATNTPPPATATNTPLPTATPTDVPPPSPTPTASAITVHVGDLDGVGATSGNRWEATAAISVHDIGENPVSGMTVSGTWAFGGRTRAYSCVTDVTGQCDLVQSSIPGFVTEAILTVDNVSGSSPYQPVDNHDPDADSDGTSITVSKP